MEERDMEKESLSAILEEDFKEISENEVEIQIRPPVGPPLFLHVEYQPGYPETSDPILSLRGPLEGTTKSHLDQFLVQQIEENRGYAMIYTIIQQLTEELEVVSKYEARGLFSNLDPNFLKEILYYLTLPEIYPLIQTSTQMYKFCFQDWIIQPYLKEKNIAQYQEALGWEARRARFSEGHPIVIQVLDRQLTGADWDPNIPWKQAFIGEVQECGIFQFQMTNHFNVELDEEGDIMYRPQPDMISKLGVYRMISEDHPMVPHIFPRIRHSPCQFTNFHRVLGYFCFTIHNPSGIGHFLKNIAAIARGDIFNLHNMNQLRVVERQYLTFKVQFQQQQVTKLWLSETDSNHCFLLGPIFPDFQGNMTTEMALYHKFFYSNTLRANVEEQISQLNKTTSTQLRIQLWCGFHHPSSHIIKHLGIKITGKV